ILRRALQEAPAAIALGADVPGLPRARLEQARRALARHDAVLGPAADGGYVLLGLRACEPGLLAGLPWSTPSTLRATRARLRDRGLSLAELPPSFDVDEAEDLERLRRALRAGVMHAPRTAALLEVGVA